MKRFEIAILMILIILFTMRLGKNITASETKIDTNIKNIEIGNLNNDNTFEEIKISLDDKITLTYKNNDKSFTKILNNEDFGMIEKKIREYSSIVLEEQGSFEVEKDKDLLFMYYIKLSNCNKEISIEGTNRKPTNFDKFFNSLLDGIK